MLNAMPQSQPKCKQPGGQCCYHTEQGPYWSIIPPSPICCHCGQTEASQHGPYRSGYQTYPYITIPFVPNTSPFTVTC